MQLLPGVDIDGFHIGERIHAGAMGDIYHVTGPGGDFPMVMKVPRAVPGDSGEGLINFEIESMILPALSGLHVPRFVAAGDLARSPYLVMERIEGESVEHIIARGRVPAPQAARIGAGIADALHDLHRQDTIHLDVKPDNAILRPDGDMVLVDFGLAHHAHYPDLLVEEQRRGAGSPPYLAPEQVLGDRSDPRSDLFALGVMLYEMTTGALPFGAPATQAGLRDRMWIDPVPPSARVADMPPWLQEIILRCLEPSAADRYQSAAHVAFDLRHPDDVELTARARKSRPTGLLAQFGRWWRARGAFAEIRSAPKAIVGDARVVLVAVDTVHLDDERHPALQQTVARILSIPAEYRLICVSVIPGGPGADRTAGTTHQAGAYHEHLVRLRHWVEPLHLPASRLSLHVMEAADPADLLVDFARRNNVDLIVLGAPQPGQLGLAWWRSAASAVTAKANCNVYVARVPIRGAA